MMLMLIILLCLVLSSFFSGMETGVLLLNRVRIRHLQERGSSGARILMGFLKNPSHLFSTVLVGNTVVNSVATVLIATFFMHEVGLKAALAATLLFALILGFYGDLVPKALFRRFPNRLATRFAPALWLTYWVLWPLVQLFALLARSMLKLLGGRFSSGEMFVTREELKFLAREDDDGIALTGEQRNLVASILDSPNATAKDVMRPKAEVITTSTTESTEQRCARSTQTCFSRLPLEDSSNPTQWNGLWVTYDVLFKTGIMSRNPPRIRRNTKLEEVLQILRQSHSPMAFVRDSDGNDVGIVTIEDVLRHYLGKVDL